jgi:MoaA/NifB/PqqE/SkfB family radical SAM enzyme
MNTELVIVWRVTEKCNLACPFCAYDRNLMRPRAAADPGQVLRFGEILRDERRDSDRRILVSWLGGEPFLWPTLLEVAHIFKHKFDLRVAVTTNGLALKSAQTRERLAADFEQITISIDDLGAAHDRLRGAQGLFESLRANLLALSSLVAQTDSHLLIRVNTVLMHNNLPAFENLCSQLADWGVAELTFNSLGGRDRPEFFPANRLTRADADWLCAELPRIREQMQARGLKIQGSRAYLERIAGLAQDNSYNVTDCAPGRQFIFIDENGLAAPCHFSVDGYGYPIDELVSRADLAALPAIFFARQQRQQLAACRDCRSTHVFGKFEAPLRDLITFGETA